MSITVTVTVTVTVTGPRVNGPVTKTNRNGAPHVADVYGCDGEAVGKRGRARAVAYEVALGETKELIVSLDCVEMDGLAPHDQVAHAQQLADRPFPTYTNQVAAMLTKLIRSARCPDVTGSPRLADLPSAVDRDRDRDRDRS